jgi:hypothetical protein
MNDFPYPEIQSFERLQVSDGLMINSERWRLAHEYHQQRQNVQFQSLFRSGIICGLGVAPIEAPADLPAKFRDGRWVQIQPGIAIDLYGNFIVVPTPLDFRISTAAYDRQIELVYLVLSYVDPAKLKRAASNEVLVETFRVNEKTDPPIDTDIEICRIAIAEGGLEIQKPADLFVPTLSELDMRYRLKAKLRPENTIRIAYFRDHPNSDRPNSDRQNLEIAIHQNFKFLGQALSSIASSLSLADKIGDFDLQAELTPNQLLPYQLIYLNNAQAATLNEATQLALREYVDHGGLILIETDIHNTKLENLLAVQYELQSANAKLKKNAASQFNDQFNGSGADYSSMQAEIQSEIEAIAIEVQSQADDFLATFKSNLPMEAPMRNFAELERNHPLRSQPFLFANLPVISEQPIQVLTNGGIITIFGSLSELWGGLADTQELSREQIRTFQELGINILNYAAQRHAIASSMQINPKYSSDPTVTSDQRRVTNMTAS